MSTQQVIYNISFLIVIVFLIVKTFTYVIEEKSCRDIGEKIKDSSAQLFEGTCYLIEPDGSVRKIE